MTTTTSTMMSKTPTVGDKAPNFELVTAKGPDGKAVKYNLLEACKKGPVIVAFFPGAFTGTCTKEMCNFRDNWAEFAKMNAQIVGVSVDSFHAQKAFAEKNNLTFPFASDLEHQTVNGWNLVWNSWWGPVAKRATFVVDRSGVVKYANVQSNMDLEPNYAEIKTVLKGLK